jgi:hypothetical protein
MSCTLILLPMAIAMAGSMGAGTLLISKSEHLDQEELDLKKEKIMQETKNSLGLEQEEVKPLILQTIMRNASILQEATVNLGYESDILNKQQMKIQLENGNIIFYRGEDDIFLAIFSGDIPKENAENYLTEFQDTYTTLVQQNTYQKLLEKIKERNLNLESEEITEDNSIVLTLVVQE